MLEENHWEGEMGENLEGQEKDVIRARVRRGEEERAGGGELSEKEK